jgi:hypothetical protein
MTEGANSCSMRREKCRRIVCLKYESHGLFRSSLAHSHQWLLVWLRILQHMCCIYFRACAQQSKLWLLHFPSCSFLQCPTNDKMYLILLGKITIKRKTLNSQCNYFFPQLSHVSFKPRTAAAPELRISPSVTSFMSSIKFIKIVRYKIKSKCDGASRWPTCLPFNFVLKISQMIKRRVMGSLLCSASYPFISVIAQRWSVKFKEADEDRRMAQLQCGRFAQSRAKRWQARYYHYTVRRVHLNSI